MTTRHASVESTLVGICEIDVLDIAQWSTVQWLIKRRGRDGSTPIVMVPVWVWRTFYMRHADWMHDARRAAVRDLAAQFKAEDDAAAALKAIDAAWRDFHARNPGSMAASAHPKIRALAEKLESEGDTSETLKSNAIATTSPP